MFTALSMSRVLLNVHWKRSDCQIDLNGQKGKDHDYSENIRQTVKKIYEDKKESFKHYKKKNMWKIEHPVIHIRK